MTWQKTKLTVKQKIFVDEYLIDFNGTRAYKIAYPNVKNDNTAGQLASRLLKNAKIGPYIEERMKDRQRRTEITQDRVLNELAKIAFADIKDYLEYRTEKTVVSEDVDGTPIVDYKQIVDLMDSKDVDTSVVQEVSISKDGTFKFKMYDKQKALADVGKHLGMFVDKVEHSGSMGINNPFDELSVEELRKLAGQK